MQKTTIGWTDFTSNPVRAVHLDTYRAGWACTKVSEGCAHCYSETMNRRLGTQEDYRVGAPVRWVLREDELQAIARRKKRARIFVGDMTDLLHAEVPDAWLDRIFGVMSWCRHLTFQVLTKRAERLCHYSESLASLSDHGRGLRVGRSMGYTLPDDTIGGMPWPLPNVWLGVSVEDQCRANERIPWLLETPAAVRFVSCEPLLGPIDLRGTDGNNWPLGPMKASHRTIHWAIIGGESGREPRPMKVEWLQDLVAQCQAADIPVFVKQASGPRPVMQGDIPDHLWQRKEFPVHRVCPTDCRK